MRKLLVTIFLLVIIALIANNYEYIMRFAMINIVYRDEILNKEDNSYYREYSWNYVQQTDDFYPNNKQDILNIFYSALNGGWSEVTFYCPEEYATCLDDVEEMTDSNYLLSNINNFVATYNSYSKIYINLNNLGRINIQFVKIYNDEMIMALNQKIDQIYSEIIKENMSDYEKIKAAHDYIINNTVYDQQRANEVKNGINTENYHISNTAYGTLINHKAICGGYTDAMALFLDKFGIPNYKVASTSHIWNYVYLNNEWLHLDLTWDDPVTSNNENRLEYNYFLIKTAKLQSIDTGQHNYEKEIYSE
ncbi:MAG: transglutaminase domain-containing protein [Bacilli bacterium]|nr:transglutaminase domain-containing protein [Bacilli bacterium]